jgi:hypothetical protein
MPKLVKCDGKLLEVRDVGDVICTLAANGAPIKLHGTVILEDDAARDLVRELAAAQKVGVDPS